jgi:hypothetical protein
MVTGKPGYTGLRYQDFGSVSYPWLPVTWDAGGANTIASYSKAVNSWQVFADSGTGLVQQGDFDAPGTHSIKLETSDIDFDQNDQIKDWFRFAVQIDDTDRTTAERLYEVAMDLWSSTNGGSNWRYQGRLHIPPTKSGGHLNFRITSAFARFRLVDVPVADIGIPSYTVTNYIIDASYAHAVARDNKEGA